MRRFLFLVVTTTAAAAALVVAACTSTASSPEPSAEAGGPRRDGGIVGPAEAGAYDAGTPQGPPPSCEKYCDLVMASCTGNEAQYASRSECLEICARLPPGDAGDKESNTVACRQYYAGSPAQTNAGTYCLPAGPFGGGVCGLDRCIAFCGLTLGACAPDAGPAPYGSYSECQTACAGYVYTEDGGESPMGPTNGDTLNCRLFHARSAIHDGSGCVDVGPDSPACK
jgi:hypothetical protein